MPPHPHHDAILAAFDRVGADPIHCRRCGENGYSHIHGPRQSSHPAHCTQHSICVETFNGTVGFRNDAAASIPHLQDRVPLRIAEHPLGYSCRPDFGGFSYGITADDILRFWSSFDVFAKDVVGILSTTKLSHPW